MKPNDFNDLILSRRWFSLLLNAVFVVILLWISYENATSERASFVLVGINCFVAGFGVAATLHILMMPGLFKGMTQANESVMYAQIEKNLNQALADFQKRHPEVDIKMDRVQ